MKGVSIMAQLMCNMVSYSLGYGIDLAITLPTLSSCDIGSGKQPCHTPIAKYPVLYLLHGHGNDYQSWYRFTSAERFAEEHRIALVCCSVGNKAYMNASYGENYYDLIAHELPEFICGNFPISDRPEDTYIAGLSMGGYGTLAHALTRPKAWCAAGAFSPAIRINSRNNLEHSFPTMVDLYKELEKRFEENSSLPALYLCCGENDFLYKDVLNFHNTLVQKNINHTWHSVPDFEHEWKFWDIELEKFINWLPRTDPYAKLSLHHI